MASPIKLSDELLRIIGSIVVYHAEIEHHLDVMVSVLYIKHPSSHKFSKQYPLTFAAETTFLRQCLLGLPELQAYSDEGIQILDTIGEISEDRSHIVHGFVSEWRRDHRTLSFTRVYKMDGAPRVVIVNISEERLARDLERIDAFRDPVEKFTLRFMEAFGSE
jgi:hypothetical protein